MIQETMTSEERMMAAINLERPDRVPISFLLDSAPAARLLGLRSWEIAAQGLGAQIDVLLQVFDAFGGGDAVNPPLPPEILELNGLKTKSPSEDSPENQTLEAEVWSADEYDLLVDIGYERFVTEHLVFRVSELTSAEQVESLSAEWLTLLLKFLEDVKGRGAIPYFPTWAVHPFFWMSLTRSMVKFTEDLYYRPDKVEKAMKALVPAWIEAAIGIAKATGAKIMECTEERAGGFFYPLEIFERFWWPYTLEIVDAFWSEGIVTVFHLDQCWDKNLPYFKQLPKGSAVLDLDGCTDIFAAKEVLGGHLCLGGDIHPTLLSLGTPGEVEAYCKRLIDEVGYNGGLLLNVGCMIPYQIKPENFEAILSTGKTYQPSDG